MTYAFKIDVSLYVYTRRKSDIEFKMKQMSTTSDICFKGIRMRRRTLLSASLGLGSLASWAYMAAPASEAAGLLPYSGTGQAFGTTVTIQVLHAQPQTALAAIDAALQAVRRVDALMSLHQQDSQVFRLNRLGQLDQPDPHLLAVLNFAQQLSRQTAGAFDVTVQPLWQAFSQAQTRGELPSTQTLAQARALVNWRGLDLSPQRIRLAKPGMGITLNGLAQGYAVDLAMAALRTHGIAHALLDTGEFGALGDKASGQPWVLGVKHPRHAETLAARVALDGRPLSTSGDYETFFSPDYVHHHIFDPGTGDSPLALASVSVLAPTGLMADGLSTAFMVLGPERALALATSLPQVDALLIHKDGRQQVTANFPALAA
jgi:thiamine biosynthesis lipoprotein